MLFLTILWPEKIVKSVCSEQDIDPTTLLCCMCMGVSVRICPDHDFYINGWISK